MPSSLPMPNSPSRTSKVQTPLEVPLRGTSGSSCTSCATVALAGGRPVQRLRTLLTMILSVTVLGNKDGMSPATVGKKVVEYLEGGRTVAAPGRRPGSLVELPSPQGGSVAYYADSAGLRPGRWALGKEGDVDPAELAVLLAGYDPDTLAPLISAQGSAGRAARSRVVSPTVDLELDIYTATQAAQVLGVSVSYLRRMLRQEVKTGGEATSGITRTANGAWQIDREALARLAALRNGTRIVAGYDLTFSPPKSVSVVWAGGDDATRSGGPRQSRRLGRRRAALSRPSRLLRPGAEAPGEGLRRDRCRLPAHDVAGPRSPAPPSRCRRQRRHGARRDRPRPRRADGLFRGEDGELRRRGGAAPPTHRAPRRHLDRGVQRDRRGRGGARGHARVR